MPVNLSHQPHPMGGLTCRVAAQGLPLFEMTSPNCPPSRRLLVWFLALFAVASTALANVVTNLPAGSGTDTDRDGLPDVVEIAIGSSPTVADTDGDGFNDAVEYLAGTGPRDRDSFPIFQNSVPPRQYLPGDTLLLTPLSLKNVVTYTNIEIVPIEVPPDAPPDAPTTQTNITLFPTFATYQWSKDGQTLSNQTSLTLAIPQISTTNAGLYRLSAEINFITGFTTNSGVNEAGETTNNVVTNRQKAVQVGRPISVEVFNSTARVTPITPVGSLVGWGNNVFQQATIPPALTNYVVLQAVGGRAHSAALLTNGTVVAWGTNDVGQLNIPPGLSNVVSLAAGMDHTLALRSDGSVVAWGSNVRGQARVPSDLPGVQSIAAGYFHSLVVLTNGRVVAWGANDFRQTNVPVNLPAVTQVVAGGSHSVALTVSGAVVAWGNTNANRTAVPRNLGRVLKLAAGDSHTVALRADGRFAAWGANDAGQTTLPANLETGITMAAGDSYTAIVTGDGRVRVFGAVGNLFNDSRDVITKLPPGLTNSSANVFGLSSGFFHLLALRAAPDLDCDALTDLREAELGTSATNLDTDGDGLHDGIEARLGTNPLVADTDGDGLLEYEELLGGFDPLTPTEAADGSLAMNPALELNIFTLGRGEYRLQSSSNRTDFTDLGTPFQPAKGWLTNLVALPAGHRFTRLIGPDFSNVLNRDAREAVGNVATFGVSGAADRAVPNTVSGLIQIAAGDWHTLGLRYDGRVVAWGVNEDGQINVPGDLADVRAIAAGGQHSLALRASGQVVAWGRSQNGQVAVPANLPPVKAIAAGSDFSLALLEDGTVAAWGDNLRGQISVPTGLQGVTAIAAGFGHALALRSDGTVVAWGDDRFGQSKVPSGLTGVRAIAAGDLHSFAVRADGSVVCWGNNSVGQCSPPAGLTSVVQISAGFRNGAALRSDGSVVAWGEGADALTPPAGLQKVTQLSSGGFAIYALKTTEDADGDLADDFFEKRSGSDPLNPDSDGDGLTDGLEVLYGFNPSVADAAAEGTILRQAAAELTLFTLAQRTYRLETTTDFSAWTAVGTNVTNLRGASSRVLPVHPDDNRFYRLVKLSTGPNAPAAP